MGVSTSGNGNAPDGRTTGPTATPRSWPAPGSSEGRLRQVRRTRLLPDRLPVHPTEILATIYHALGIKPDTMVMTSSTSQGSWSRPSRFMGCMVEVTRSRLDHWSSSGGRGLPYSATPDSTRADRATSNPGVRITADPGHPAAVRLDAVEEATMIRLKSTVTRLDTLSTQLVTALRQASEERQRSACLAACEFVVHRVGIGSPVVDDACRHSEPRSTCR